MALAWGQIRAKEGGSSFSSLHHTCAYALTQHVTALLPFHSQLPQLPIQRVYVVEQSLFVCLLSNQFVCVCFLLLARSPCILLLSVAELHKADAAKQRQKPRLLLLIIACSMLTFPVWLDHSPQVAAAHPQVIEFLCAGCP